MTIEDAAILAIDACQSEGVEYMLTGAFAYGIYGIPRSTMDVDLVLSIQKPQEMFKVLKALETEVLFGDQQVFDTLTFGRRWVGKVRKSPEFQIELFELFEDDFVMAQFQRKKELKSVQLSRTVWVPTAEDVVVQKVRWAREKDLGDAVDVVAVQGVEGLDMQYVREWCEKLGISDRLAAVLERAT